MDTMLLQNGFSEGIRLLLGVSVFKEGRFENSLKKYWVGALRQVCYSDKKACGRLSVRVY